jgi:EmrB/QacA subfamily drug resistance transporter
MSNATSVRRSVSDGAIVTAERQHSKRWAALAVIALVQFIIVLDITVVNVALPHIQTSLHFSRAGLAWVVDGYVLTAGGLLLLGGRLADLLGRKRMFLIGVAVFAMASVLSGAAADSAMLVGARFAQGVGEAIAIPAAFGLVALLFTEPKERATAIGITGGVAGLGGTLGPVISGLLISVASWRWIFYINVPVAVIAILAVSRLVAESRASTGLQFGRAAAESGRTADVAGAVLGTGGLVGIVYGFIAAANHPWDSPQVWAALAAGAAAGVAFMVRERTALGPLVPTGFLRNRTRVISNVTAVLFASVFFTVFFLLTLYFQQVQHYSALRTGVAYVPLGVVISIGIGLASQLAPKIGVKPLFCSGALLFSAGVLLLSRITVHGSYWSHALPGMLVMALGSGINFATFGIASVHQVSGEDASLASGVQQTAQQVGGAVGLAVLASLALRHATTAVAHGMAATSAATDGTVLALRVGAGVALAGALLVALIRFDRPTPNAEIETAGLELEPAAA